MALVGLELSAVLADGFAGGNHRTKLPVNGRHHVARQLLVRACRISRLDGGGKPAKRVTGDDHRMALLEIHGCGRAGLDTDFVQDVFHVLANRLCGNAQSLRDSPVGFTQGDMSENFGFTGRQFENREVFRLGFSGPDCFWAWFVELPFPALNVDVQKLAD